MEKIDFSRKNAIMKANGLFSDSQNTREDTFYE